jgi:glycosyltransferase involved in cell wall biosynthesis
MKRQKICKDKSTKPKLAIVARNPNYYQDGIWIQLNELETVDIMVNYLSDFGINPNLGHPSFGNNAQWKSLIQLDKYPHLFLKNYGSYSSSGLLSRVNLGLLPILFKHKYNVILIHGYDSLSCWFSLLAAKLMGVKVVWRGESTLKGDESSSFRKRFLKKVILSRFFNVCDVVMYSCTGNKDYLQFYGVPESKLFPIPCAVDNDFFQSERRKYLGKENKIREELGIKEDDFVILFVARITENKRPMDLVKAIETINKKNITILFVGDGIEKESVEKYCKVNNVKAKFVGFKNQTEISEYYSVGNLFVLISGYDNSPKAMNEAMNFELPVICTKRAGTAYDLVKDNENGFLVETGDIVGIAEKIGYLNQNRGVAKKMGQRSWKIVKNWNFQEDAKGIEKAVNFVMKK